MKLMYLCILLMLSSCGESDFKKVEDLGEFRILAIKARTLLADAPEVTPGEIVQIKLFVSDVKAAGREIIGTTVSCIDPGIAFGAKVSCDSDPSSVFGTYTIDTRSMAANLYTGFMPDLDVTVPNTILIGRSAREQFNGVGYIVIFNFTVDGKRISAFKRITVSNRGSPNTNPNGSSILLNGGAVVLPQKNDKLQAVSSAPEIYNYQTIEGKIESRTEKMQVAWYLTEGELEKPKSDIDEDTKYLGDGANGPSLIIAIIRDERGGVDVFIKSFP